MNMESLFRFFNQYHKISNASQNALLEVIHETHVAKNELLQKIGVTCKTIYFIITTVLKLRRKENENKNNYTERSC